MSTKNVYQESTEFSGTEQRDLYPQIQQSYSYSLPTGYNQFDYLNANPSAYRNSSLNAATLNNTGLQTENTDNGNWMFDYRFVSDMDRGMKLPDSTEITNKSSSPSSCFNNLEALLPDCYKNIGFNKSTEKPWYYNANCTYQKYNEYPSCTQVWNESYLDTNNGKSCAYNNDCVLYKNPEKTFVSQGPNSLGYNFDKLEASIAPHEYFNEPQVNCMQQIPFQSIDNIDQQTELSNDESDIIVEESDEENTDYSEDQEKSNCTPNCIVCNVLYSPLGSLFYFLTAESPLTMSTQKPLIGKLSDIIGFIPDKRYYLCNQCLGLINTIDHLQFRLENCKFELLKKFEKTSQSENFSSLKIGTKKRMKAKIKPWRNIIFSCKLCHKRFSLLKFCRYHLKKHKTSFLCEICGKQYFNFHKLQFHIKRHKKQKVKLKSFPPFVCKICRKRFRTRSNLKEHTNYCSGKLPYNCTHLNCDKKFPTITKMKNHVKLKHDKKFVAICSICNIGFVKMSSYKSHMISHNAEKKFSCRKCDKSYKTLSNLNFHMKFHNKMLPFVCSICDKGFMRKEYLEAHVNIHKGIKNFKCQTCGKTFVSQKNLDAHMKYHDGTIKKRMCNICGKELSKGLEEHLRTHTNLREFECDHCERSFNTKGALAKHLKNKHPKSL